jgi:hypothetical protein
MGCEAEPTDRFKGSRTALFGVVSLKHPSFNLGMLLQPFRDGLHGISSHISSQGSFHVPDKIRQELQVLRDLKLLEFFGGRF